MLRQRRDGARERYSSRADGQATVTDKRGAGRGHEVVTLDGHRLRYEQIGGGTSTTTERRVAFSPEIPGPRVGEARSEWQIFADVARRVRPDLANEFGCETADAIRAEIARVVPSYAGIERLHVGAREPHTPGCERIDVRGGEPGMSVAGQIIPAQLVAHDEEDVAGGAGHGGWRLVGRRLG